MDIQLLYWIGAAIVAGISVYNFVVGIGRKSGVTEAQMAHIEANEKAWAIKFDALYAAFQHHQAETSSRFEKVVERLNDALLMMAREHPTKSDLQTVKNEILDRIDSQYGEPSRRRSTQSKGPNT